MTKILVVSNGAVGTQMAAPGIRAYNIARVLHEQVPGAEVTLALPEGFPSDLDQTSVAFAVARPSVRELAQMAPRQDIIVAGRLSLSLLPATLNARVVFDMYSPLVTEWANVSRWFGKRHRRAWLDAKRKHLLMELAAADFVLCANDRQRDYVLGIMCTQGMVTSGQFDVDTSLRARIAVAPLGIRPHEPPTRPSTRRINPAIRETDVVLLWNGTIIEWYDIATLLHALHVLAQERDDIKLIFLGTEYPQQAAKGDDRTLGSGAVVDAIALARELGLLDTQVFFRHGWADDTTTEQHLVEADIGVSTYYDNLETHFSFRVRYLDLFWASLPIICTRGDTVSEIVDGHNLGRSVPAKDVTALVDAIRLLANPQARALCRSNFGTVRGQYQWERTLEPLIEFCKRPAGVESQRRGRVAPLIWRSLDWMFADAHEKLRFAYRKKLFRSGHSGLG